MPAILILLASALTLILAGHGLRQRSVDPARVRVKSGAQHSKDRSKVEIR